MPRSKKSQSKHDSMVRKLAKQYLDKDYDVDADLKGWNRCFFSCKRVAYRANI